MRQFEKLRQLYLCMKNKEKRKEFSDIVKAEIFVRDKALCAFNCRSLWLLDYGAIPTIQYDWIDHISPASKGGNNSIENGILTNWFDNKKKGNKISESIYLLQNGLPTEHYYSVYEIITDDLVDNIKRFSKLHFSDYYFNRALFYLHLGLEHLLMPTNENGEIYKRDENYYAKSMQKKLLAWKKLVNDNNVSTFENRNLITYQSDDIEIMLKLRDNSSVENILKIISELFPYYKKNYEIIEKKDCLKTIDEIREIEHLLNDKYISARLKSIVKQNVTKLKYIITVLN